MAKMLLSNMWDNVSGYYGWLLWFSTGVNDDDDDRIDWMAVLRPEPW